MTIVAPIAILKLYIKIYFANTNSFTSQLTNKNRNYKIEILVDYSSRLIEVIWQFGFLFSFF